MMLSQGNKTRKKNKKGLRKLACMAMAAIMIFGFSGVAFAAEWYIDEGDITVEATEGGHNVTQNNNTVLDDTEVVITQKDKETATDNTLTVKGEDGNKAEVTLDDVNIEAGKGEAGVKVEGDADITLAEGSENKVTGGAGAAGVEVETGDSVTIKGDGSLEANGGQNGAGIGSGDREHAGDITIDGGKIEANGGGYTQGNGGSGAGIGGGNSGHGGNITINNGDVTANGQGGGAGIGGGSNGYNSATGNGATVTINGGTVNAKGDTSGAGIGGGFQRTGNVTINGGNVSAQGGSEGGAGIGGGLYSMGNANKVTITGGIINAIGGGINSLGGAGIGTGGKGSSGAGGTIIINGTAKITAKGGSGAAGIGGGDKQGSGSISITGSVTINTTGGNSGAGIGSGADGAVGIITINSGKINATGGSGGAGIGAGSRGAGGEITIGSDASVTAIAGSGAAGIGGGSYSPNGGTIIVKQGAKVYAFSDGTKRWAIDITNSDFSGIENMLNGRFEGISASGKVDDTTALPLGTELTLDIVDQEGNLIDTIKLPIFYENKVMKDENGKTIWDENGNPKVEKIWHTFHSFALQLPEGEYYIKNSDGQYNDQFADYPYDVSDLTDRGMLFVVKDGQMTNYDKINWTTEEPVFPEKPVDPDPEEPIAPPVDPQPPVRPETPVIPPANPGTPVAPDVPVITPVTVTPNTVVPVAAPVNTPGVTINENQTPLASGTQGNAAKPETTTIDDPQTPLAGNLGASWALLNLILAIGTAVVMIVLLIGYFFGKKKKEEEQAAEEEKTGKLKRKGIFRLMSILPGIGGIIAFVLTENMNNPMILTDKWTLLMIVIALVQIVFTVFSIKKHKDDGEQETLEAQNA